MTVLVTAALALTGLQAFAPPGAQAAGSSGLVIEEVYGAGGNTNAVYNADFVELYNPQATDVSTDGLVVQYRSASGGVGGTQALPSTTVPAGEHFLIQMGAAGATGAALPTPNLVASPAVSMAAGGGQVILGTATSYGSGDLAGAPNVVDMVGQVGATSYETAAAGFAASTSQSLNRSAAGTDTNSNLADFSLAAPSPTPGHLPLAATDPGIRRVVVDTPTSFGLQATGGTQPYSWTATGLPPGLDVATNGTVSGTPTTVGSYPVQATVTDSAAEPATDSTSFVIKVNPKAGASNTIAEIQGTGDETPYLGQTVTTEGVVTARYPAPSGLNGFYIQTPGPDTPDASDAVFVFGGSSLTTYPAIGTSVRVTGTATEFNGLTEISTSNTRISVIGDLGTVTPKTQVPASDCALGSCPTTAAELDAAREPTEGELFQPVAPWTASDVYDGGPAYNNGSNSSQNFGEIGVAADSTTPLIAPTEVTDAQDTAAIAERVAYNNAHRLILDDGSSTNYSSATSSPFPWMTATYAPRVGARVTFPGPVVLTWGFNQWRIQPTTQVVGAPTGDQPQFEQTRADNAAPAPVGGDLKLATFNVLNFFPTTGEEYESTAPDNHCTYYTDRAGNRITTNRCGNPTVNSGNGPRGAADDANLARQRAKIVSAINTAGADIVSLEELENSAKFGKDRDYAISELVSALNADAGAGTWAYVPSPPAAQLPPLDQQDVIRTGFIYRPDRVATVGPSVVLADQSGPGGDFEDAREPLAQEFKMVGHPDAHAFAVIVNHFKSKGSGNPDPYGQGNANDQRVAQAHRLATFADAFSSERKVRRVFLVGDFNAYSEEDPIQVLEAAGYTNLDSTADPTEESYDFDGAIGSLDHVLVNKAAGKTVTGVDVWAINAYESVYYEYSRFNYNVTDLYDAGPFRSSDHNPEIVGVELPGRD